jgi:hypothetical protein
MKGTVAILIMMVLAATAAAQATDADGWNGAKWGMTLAQVRAAVTSPLERDPHQLHPRKPTSVFRTSEPFKMLDAPVWAVFSFSPDDS